jgi:hypothetical protein
MIAAELCELREEWQVGMLRGLAAAAAGLSLSITG